MCFLYVLLPCLHESGHYSRVGFAVEFRISAPLRLDESGTFPRAGFLVTRFSYALPPCVHELRPYLSVAFHDQSSCSSLEHLVRLVNLLPGDTGLAEAVILISRIEKHAARRACSRNTCTRIWSYCVGMSSLHAWLHELVPYLPLSE